MYYYLYYIGYSVSVRVVCKYVKKINGYEYLI